MAYPGAVEYKRQYTLWLLILLVIICWPAAIIYYFTRPKVPVQTLGQTYVMPQAPMTTPAAAPATAAPMCPTCGKPGTWVAQYNRYYCYTDQKYL